jgi:hypothetical protein
VSEALERRWWIGLLLSVALPVTVFGWVALRQPLHGDGALNLQVSSYLVEHGEYARQYDYARGTQDAIPVPRWECCADERPPWVRPHPYEVQTNGPFIAVAALGILVFGDNSVGYQFASLAFTALFAAVLWALLRRRWPIAAVFAPITVLLIIPQPFGLVIGGFGEVPGLALLLLAILLLVAAVRSASSRRTALAMTGASLATGAAVVTKLYMMGGVAPLAVGWLLVWYLRRPRWTVMAAQPLALMAPVAAFELYKLVNVGSVSAYRALWRENAGPIAVHSGLEDSATSPSTRGLGRIPDQIHRLATATGLPAELLVLLVVVAVAVSALVIALVWRRGRPDDPVIELGSAQVMATVLGVTFLAWWLVSMPEQWAGPRRAYPVVIPLAVSVVLAVGVLALLVSDRRRGDRDRWVVAGAGLSLLVIVALVVGAPATLTDAVTADTAALDANERLAASIEQAPADRQYYGIGFWSSPILSLMADRPLRNLEEVDPCALEEDAVLVSDLTTQAALGHPPPSLDGTYTYSQIIKAPAGRLYDIETTAAGCPND